MNELQITGGARIGRANASIPFASLKVNKEQLEINASIIGNLVFQPSDIVSIEPYHFLPLIGQGVKINHTVESYDKKIIFWTFKDPEMIVQQIQATGFLDYENIAHSKPKPSIIKKQAQGGFPLKKGFIILAVLVWNGLFLFDLIPYLQNNAQGLPIGNGILSALGFIFISSLLILAFPPFRRLVLKEGRTLDDINKFAIFAMLICGILIFGLITNNALQQVIVQ